MENISIQDKNVLLMTDYCFKVLSENILEKFIKENKISTAIKVKQHYGFGDFDINKPNLRAEFAKLAGGFINGKYLYDKIRELNSGKPVIKLNGYYKYVFFKYLGHDYIDSFLQSEIEDENERSKQLHLLRKSVITKNYYYISYHFGENKEVIKGQVSVLNDWKNVHYKYIYPEKDGTVKEFLYHGVIVRRSDTLHIHTKTLLGGKMVDGGNDVFYIGHSEPWAAAYLIGTYSAWDIYNKTIAGRIIFEKCESKEEMVKKSYHPKVPAYIVQEIRNKRIVNDGIVPDDFMGISHRSPYHTLFAKIPGKYELDFFVGQQKVGFFEFDIDKNTSKINTLNKGILIEKDHIEIVNNGSVVHFSFCLIGLAQFSKLEIFFKTYYLNDDTQNIEGVYSGLNMENQLINGRVNGIFIANTS